jgi:hypothetical protein
MRVIVYLLNYVLRKIKFVLIHRLLANNEDLVGITAKLEDVELLKPRELLPTDLVFTGLVIALTEEKIKIFWG